MRSVIYSIYIILCMNCISGCIPKNEIPAQNLLKKEDLYTLSMQEGLTVQITNYGGKIVSIIVPDTPHHDHFPSCVLEPGREYRSTTVYRFDIEEL